MRKTILAAAALAAVAAPSASAAPAPGLGLAGAVHAVAPNGNPHVTCSFDRNLSGVVSFRGAMTPGAGQFWMSCTVTSGGVTLSADGGLTASGKGALPAGPVTICATATVAPLIGSSRAHGCATW